MKCVLQASICLLPLLLNTMLPADEISAPVNVKVKKQNRAKNWQQYKTNLLTHLTDFEPKPVRLSTYGGRLDRQEKATGFFYTKKTDGGWVLVDPEGYHYFNIGVNSTSPNDKVADHKKAFARTFTDTSDWARKTRALLVEDLKFNSLGCWSDWQAFKTAETPVPYIRRWNLMATYGKQKKVTYAKYGHAGFQNDVLPVFDKAFAEFCDKACERMKETKDDPWLIGHFSDNELPFKSRGRLKNYLSCPKDDESHIAAANWLKKKGVSRDKIKGKHDEEFTELVLKTYYKTVHDAIRKHDPNHLILGTRLHGYASGQDICYTASGPYVDVVSINYYNRWTPDQAALNRRAKLAGKPIMITEWYAKGADSGLNNTAGAGFTVPTQKDRGYFYENFTIGLLRNRNVVGWHWFRYIDDGDLKTKGKSSNKGIVDLNFKTYKDLADSMRAINTVHYQLEDYLRKADSKNLLSRPTTAK